MKEYRPGDKLKIKTKDQEYVGILMERSGLADDKHLVIKLDSGYNVGIKKEGIEKIEKLKQDTIDEEYSPVTHVLDPSKKNISVLATGGTIASRVDYLTGGVHSAFSAEELIAAVPELANVANVSGRQIFNKFSENMAPLDWVRIAEETYEEIKKKQDGIVITHGTDTMGYTSAALSFMLKTPVPVILTGAQRSSDRGSSDAALNLTHATYAATHDFSGTYVLMHAQSSDSYSSLHLGTKVKKLHSSRRDAFKTVNGGAFAKVSLRGVEFLDKYVKVKDAALDTKLDDSVFLLKYAPGLKPATINSLVDLNYHGIVIEGTGQGHISDSLIDAVKSAADSGVFVSMTSQTVYGRVNMNVYSTGRMLLESGVMGCEDMLSETAYVKLMWVLGHTRKRDKVEEMMLTNIAGELSERTSYTQE